MVMTGEVHVVRRNPNRHGRCSSHPGTSRGGPVPELVMVNHENGEFGLPSLMKSATKVLRNGSLGSSYKATMANGVSVVVKRTKEMNSLGKDEFDAVVKNLGKLKHSNVLTPLAYHYRIEEKLFIYEFAENGSLLYRNVLLGTENRLRVSEYGLCSLVSTNRVGTLMAYNIPEAKQHGKVCHKSDVYCLGIIILEILTVKFPFQYLEHDIASGSNSLGEMEKLLHIGSLCTKTSPDERLDLKEAITMMQEKREDTAVESDPRATTIEASSSLHEGHADAKLQDDSSSIREGNV
ncbi:hypothetical protein F3Y22_tig00117026pilonHSYRG00022 [Hibiscus syriacus]|uniref:Protein kinase domain-containing protein n=1 Tax=Hibiscus syriacus TaxID=106335 RepID=A0A6A2WHS7_HIBSY|nr:hypothetical protein F3Y22_tig00117026pilonHSYRG00022 [Hibiscus syriacus]